MISRRTALRIVSAGAAGVALASRSRAAWMPGADDVPMFHKWDGVRDKHVLLAKGASGNMVLVVGKGGTECVLIDTQTCPFGSQIRREGEKLGGKVACVINTHHHPEITGGNYAFARDTRVLAHAKAK